MPLYLDDLFRTAQEKHGTKVKVTIYIRLKNEAGRWRYSRVNLGRGRRPAGLSGPFFLRYTAPDGKQPFISGGDTLAEAQEAAERLRLGLEAQAKGLTVEQLDDLSNANRVAIKSAIEQFLEVKKGKSPKTLAAYRHNLNEFLESLPSKVRFIDEITADVLRGFKNRMAKDGYAGKTQHNRLLTVLFLLKKNGMKNPIGWDEMPTIEEEAAKPYEVDELKKLFAAMHSEEQARYKFFLGTGCRDKEVTFASWTDIDFSRGIYHVRKKDDVGFTPKSHESREIPLPASVVAMLKERRKSPAHARWIFVNEEGRPDNHFLRKLKRIALRAGLNCGHCRTTISKGKYDKIRKVEVTCETDPVCEHWYLHRLRKTCATRWQEAGIPVRTIQAWLGHKSLETTELYLGVTKTEKLRSQIDKAFGD